MQNDLFSIDSYANARVIHCYPVAPMSDLFRVIFDILAVDPPSEAGKLLKPYEVWVNRTVVEDELHLKREATADDVRAYALNLLRGRCEDNRGIPDEGGAFIPNKMNITLGNPRTFSLNIDERQKLVKTTMMIPEETLEWLRDYGYKRRIGIGEAVRRAVQGFQAGTVSSEQQKAPENISNAGVPTQRSFKK